MTEAERERLAMDLFTALCDEPPERRAALLDERCAADSDLRATVEDLLSADSGGIDVAADRFLEAAVSDDDSASRPADDLAAGGELDRKGNSYRILRIIGEGGMGTVYEAEQVSPRRRVAIKAIRNDLRTPAARKRFEAEAQTLARLEHSGIARLYEADARPEEGHIRAYLAMEFVDGKPLDQYAADGALDHPAMIELFLRVCEPIAYAHRRGVIHRDLKPANILVCADGQPKVLDFGVARTLDEIDAEAATRLTHAGQLIGTLSYMSPEQLDGRAAPDARADVYALGVILFRLLTGRLPIDTQTGGLAQSAHRVLTEVPTPLGKVDRRLRGDLEAIVGKALEKEPDRRYPSVAALSADLRRFQQGLPIDARGNALPYRLRLAAWRYRRPLAAAALLVAGLATFLLVESVRSKTDKLRIAEADRLAAEAARTRSEAAAARAEADHKAALYRQSLYESGVVAARSAIERGNAIQARSTLETLPADLRNFEWGLLNRMTDRSIRTLVHHDDEAVFHVDADPDHRTLAIGYQSGRFQAVRADDGHVLLDDRLSNGVTLTAVSPDGQRIAAQSTRDLAVRSINDPRESWSTSYPVPQGEARVGVIHHDFSPDGRSIAWSQINGELTISRADDGATVRRIGRVAGLRHFVFMPDSASLVVGMKDGAIRHIDLDGKTLKDLGSIGVNVSKVAVSPDGKVIAAAGGSGPIFAFDVESGRERARVPGNWMQTQMLRFGGDANTLVSAGTDGVVRSFDLQRQTVRDTFLGHRSVVMSVIPSADGKRLLSASNDGAIKTWTLPLGLLAQRSPSAGMTATGMAVAPGDGAEIIAGDNSGLVAWNPATSTVVRRYQDEGNDVAVFGLTMDYAGERLAAICRDDYVRIWTRADGRLLQRWSIAAPGIGSRALAVSPDGRHVVASNKAGNLIVYPKDGGPTVTGPAVPATLSVQQVRAGVESPIMAIAFAPNGTHLATGDAVGMIRLWSWPGLKQVAEVFDVEEPIRHLAFSPDGRWIVGGSNRSRAILRDAVTLLPVRVMMWNLGGVNSLAFNPASNRLMICCGGGPIRLWSVETGTELLTLNDDNYGRLDLRGAFSSDGRRFVSIGGNGVGLVWGE